MSTVESSGLPYCVNLATDYPYMSTKNIDIEDGLVNGAVGVLRLIEPLPSNSTDDSQPDRRLWLQFQGERTGAKARIKFRPLVFARHGLIDENWTPVQIRSANITLGGTVKCKRILPVLSPSTSLKVEHLVKLLCNMTNLNRTSWYT